MVVSTVTSMIKNHTNLEYFEIQSTILSNRPAVSMVISTIPAVSTVISTDTMSAQISLCMIPS